MNIPFLKWIRLKIPHDAYNMFNKNWTETAGLKAEGLRNIRQTIKKTIEEVAESEGAREYQNAQ